MFWEDFETLINFPLSSVMLNLELAGYFGTFTPFFGEYMRYLCIDVFLCSKSVSNIFCDMTSASISLLVPMHALSKSPFKTADLEFFFSALCNFKNLMRIFLFGSYVTTRT